VAVAATCFTLAVLAFQAVGRATIGTRSAARGAGPVVTALMGRLGCMDGGCGVGDKRRSGEAVFCRDSAGDIVEVERGWEWKALDVGFLEATK
jgi:hypothetical protein